MNYVRQAEVFNRETFNMPVHIIGVGATGSWVALQLAKMGVKDITIWDFDHVEEHNVPNQLFDMSDIGLPKVEALNAKMTPSRSSGNITVKNERFVPGMPLAGVVFNLVDSMKARKEIWEQSIKYKPNVKLLIETRMSARGGYIYTIRPMERAHIKRYENTLYSDVESETSFCGVSQSIVATAVQLSSMAVWQMINYAANGEPRYNEIMFSSEHYDIIKYSWEEGV